MDVPDDYVEYTGLAVALQKRGWTILIGSVAEGGVLPNMQWGPHHKIAWPLVVRSNLVTVSPFSELYLQTGRGGVGIASEFAIGPTQEECVAIDRSLRSDCCHSLFYLA